MILRLTESDGGSVYLSPDQNVDPVNNLVSAAVSSVSLSEVTMLTATEVVSDPSYTPPPSGGYTIFSHGRTVREAGKGDRILVLVHGLFSTVADTFGACATEIASRGNYNKIVGFNYDWTQPPDKVAPLLASYINGLGPASIDIEAHSYGTDVTLYAIPSLTVPVQNVVLLNGPLPFGGVPLAAVRPTFVRSAVWNLIGLLKNASLQQLNAAQTNNMLDALAPASSALETIATGIESRPILPQFIEVGGTKPFEWESKYPQLFQNGVIFAGDYDGIVEITSANSVDFIPSPQTVRKDALPDDHYALPCDPAAIAFVANNLATPAPATSAPTTTPTVVPTNTPGPTPTPGPTNSPTSTPTPAPSPSIMEFQILASNVEPYDFTVGPDSAIWFTENSPAIGRITTSGSIAQYPATTSQYALGIVAGVDGALWFTEPQTNKIGRMTTSGTINEYPIPSASSSPSEITSGPDGALWFLEAGTNALGQITTGGDIHEYPIPVPGSNGLNPQGIVPGPDGAMWFTEREYGRIGRMTLSGVFSAYPIPSQVGTSGASPARIIAGPDGALWFTDPDQSRIGRVTTGGIVKEYLIPWQGSNPFAIAAGPDGALWFTDASMPVIGRITTTGSFTEYLIPTAQNQTTGIVAGPDGAMWFGEQGAVPKIGRIAFH